MNKNVIDLCKIPLSDLNIKSTEDKEFDDIPMYCYKDKAVWTQIAQHKKLYEFSTILFFVKTILKKINENFIFLDIGAQCGYYSLICNNVCPKSVIHCFEPTEDNFIALSKNLSGKDNVFLHNIAISNEDREIDFYQNIKDSSCSTSCKKVYDKVPNNYIAMIKESKKIISIEMDFSKIKIVKVDIEGFDLEVLVDLAPLVSSGTIFICENIGNSITKTQQVKLAESMGFEKIDDFESNSIYKK